MDPLAMPRDLVCAAERDGRLDWLATLPRTVGDLAARWGLIVGRPFQPGGNCAWVAPARDSGGADLVLKVGWRHDEADHEAEGLRAWAGDGAVLLHAGEALPDASALLIERCVPGTTAASRPEPEQDTIIAGLLRRLWRAPTPGHAFRPLQTMCDMWSDEYEDAAAATAPIDPGLAREGMALFRALPASAERHVLLCTDLHAGNVLAAEREPWLVIDPKPYVGDPAYDVLQHLLNCTERLQTDPWDLTWRVADLAGLDRDRVLLWLFARCVQGSADSPELAQVARRIAPA